MATWTPGTKNSATFTPGNKSSAPTWTPGTISVTNSLLLKQDSGYLLLQSGDKIILNGGTSSTSWTNTNKS